MCFRSGRCYPWHRSLVRSVVNDHLLQENRRLRKALDSIAHSMTTNADVLRNEAAYTIFAVNFDSLDDAIEHVAYLECGKDISSEAAATVVKLLKDNPQFVLPSILPHGDEGKLSLLWDGDDRDTLLIVGDQSFEFMTIENRDMAIHQLYVSYTGGTLAPTVAKHIPLL